MRCPKCGGLVVYDREKVEYICALCEEVVEVSTYPYPPEYLEAVYIVRTAEKERRAREVIRRHVAENAAATLSGKDSMVALHLATSAGAAVDVVISAYAAERRLPQKVVDELKAAAESFGARRIVIHDRPWDVHASLFAIIHNEYGFDTLVTGLRRGENRGHIHAVERQLAGHNKVIKLVNPVINWSTAEVWSYIFHYRLPIPTPYRLARPDASLQRIVFP
jgi:3'-phosphoadenosine 5'-phosphosulfate sulfotransferase (PAPS reductase)/FAD synthetase